MKTSQEIKALFEELPLQTQHELLENLLMAQELLDLQQRSGNRAYCNGTQP